MATHLKADEREFIAVHREAGRSIAWLSRTLGRARSTISREFKRNGSKGGYTAHIAQQRAERRHAEGRRKSRKMLRPELRPLVLEYLRLHWSPEQIAGALKLRFPADKRLHITGQTIYNWIASGKIQYIRTAGGSVRIFEDTLWREPEAETSIGPANELPQLSRGA